MSTVTVPYEIAFSALLNTAAVRNRVWRDFGCLPAVAWNYEREFDQTIAVLESACDFRPQILQGVPRHRALVPLQTGTAAPVSAPRTRTTTESCLS